MSKHSSSKANHKNASPTPSSKANKPGQGLHHVNALAGSPKGAVKMPGPSLDTGGGDDPHDGRVHSGFTGDNGGYQSSSGAAAAPSSYAGSAVDLGAQELPPDADNDAARRNPERHSSGRRSGHDESNYRDEQDTTTEPLASDILPMGQEDGSSVAVENDDQDVDAGSRSSSNIERPSGDGNYRKAVDRTVSDADDTESERETPHEDF